MFQTNYAPITNITEKILSLREQDDSRIGILKDVLFSDTIGGICENRTFDNDGNPIKLPAAKEGDSYSYAMVLDEKSARMSIDANIRNMHKLKETGQISYKNIFIIIIAAEEGNDDLKSEVYVNPDAADCDAIVKNPDMVIASFVIIEYPSPTGKEEDSICQFNMMSQGDPSRLEEYDEFLARSECETVEKLFWIDFKEHFEANKNAVLTK